MDRTEGRRRGLKEVEPIAEIPENYQVEPWAWGGKEMPEIMKEGLALYREFLERPDDGD